MKEKEILSQSEPEQLFLREGTTFNALFCSTCSVVRSGKHQEALSASFVKVPELGSLCLGKRSPNWVEASCGEICLPSTLCFPPTNTEHVTYLYSRMLDVSWW